MTHFRVGEAVARNPDVRNASYPKFAGFGFQLAPAYPRMPSRMEEVTYAKHAAAILGAEPASARARVATRHRDTGQFYNEPDIAPRLMKCKSCANGPPILAKTSIVPSAQKERDAEQSLAAEDLIPRETNVNRAQTAVTRTHNISDACASRNNTYCRK